MASNNDKYSVPVETSLAAQTPTVADLIAWLSTLPQDALIPNDFLFRFNYMTGELSIQQVDAL